MTEYKLNKITILLIYLILALLTFTAYEGVRHNDFAWDDSDYITENTQVKSGINSESVLWAFSALYVSNWHPLTWLSHMLDCQLFGTNAGWHHLTNLLLHVANTLLLFGIFKRMTGAVWRSAFVAAVFALHPLHVESVAWISERKDLLCGFFWMLSIAAYIRYARRTGIGWYILVILAFGLGLMAKPMLVTLPFVLLLLDYWPLRRFQWKGTGDDATTNDTTGIRCQRASLWWLICEKIPLFILMAASAVITFIAQQKGGAMDMLKNLSVDMRIANAVVSYPGYIAKMIYPGGLAIMYPHSYDSLLSWQPITSAILMVVITICIIYLSRQQRPYLAVGWLWYLGTLVPVVGLVQIGAQSMADRYTYLPSIGFSIIVAWGFYELFGKKRYQKAGLAVSAGVVVIALLVGTRMQVKHWRNNLTLFGRAFSVTKGNPVTLNNLGAAFGDIGRHNEAAICYTEALRFDPNHAGIYCNLANSLTLLGKFNQAIGCYRQALELEPGYLKARANLGAVLLEQGEFEEAAGHFRQVLKTEHNNPGIYYNLANALAELGRFDEAIGNYRRAIKLEPAYVAPLNALARVLAANPNPDIRDSAEAIELAERAAKLTSYNDAAVLDTLAAAFASAGQFSKAIETAEKALQSAEAMQKNQLTEQIQNRLLLYKASKPYVEPLPDVVPGEDG